MRALIEGVLFSDCTIVFIRNASIPRLFRDNSLTYQGIHGMKKQHNKVFVNACMRNRPYANN
jgi:hypothetical protein